MKKLSVLVLTALFSVQSLHAGNDLGKIFVPIFAVGATIATGGALGPALLAGGVTAIAVATHQSAPPVVANVTDHGLEHVSVVQQRQEEQRFVDAVLNPTFVDRPLALEAPSAPAISGITLPPSSSS